MFTEFDCQKTFFSSFFSKQNKNILNRPFLLKKKKKKLIHFQIEYIRRRQHISTIDTNSPKRGGSGSGGSGGVGGSGLMNTPSNQAYVPASVPLHTGHAPISYCTLRNGTQPTANMGSSMSMVSSFKSQICF